MKAPDGRSAELNELGWWSRWAKLSWRGDGYLMTSEEFPEPFFNHAGALTCRGAKRTAAWAERELFRRGKNSTFLGFEDCEATPFFIALGYRRVDVMAVLSSAGRAKSRRGGRKMLPSPSPREWASAYLRSFYGDEGLTAVVTPIVASLSQSRAVTLLESRADDEVTGVLAIFRTKGIAGVYCVGTTPEHRREGVATSLLSKAKEIADSEGRALVLQTLKSDGVLNFYLDRGFEPLYTKAVLEKRLK
ncbi:MAG: GNAT family N-acetyltransferase [Nitrososphaerota archaeon]|nr:GNAT family N-acetyltransferase [Nitrososphaerota archaeon]MDG6903829.1 GNAT family N-acetyltransferase [Nitrososphaerota archaeon]MDG6911539.1 GNAT family N-acetyltransferase [Nitrososphaerota archaeon]MDG6940441.1 GNAT family N-acetyltransferase [Nitrososphaerota archaeon]MDG6960754.1 GNAT family N-acetyltransferase [Nitrososphaerota archaeon]